MKIAVNTRFLIKDRLEGIGWFTYETMKRITKDHPEHEFLFLFDRPFHSEFVFEKNITPLEVFPPARHPLLWFTWFELSLPLVFQKHKPDIFLSTDGFLSLSVKTPSIAVIHDINYEHIEAGMPWMVKTYYKNLMPRYAQRANRILTVSEFSKSDISNTYNINPEKIDLTCNGAGNAYVPLNETEKNQVRQKFSGGDSYFVFVGSLHPRKNVARLLMAFDTFRKQTKEKIKLLVVGDRMFNTSQIETVYSDLTHKDDVVFTGRLSREDLTQVTAAALSLVFVPCFEGFGIPIVEAMKCGVPVITSNVTSMPEVAGNAALLADPYSVLSISNAMTKIAENPSLRNELSAKGLERANFFTWEKAAQAVWDSIEKLSGSL